MRDATKNYLQDGFQLIDSAYDVFIQGSTEEELKSYIFELRTKALMYLEPSRVKEYLKIIFEKEGIKTCQDVMEYIVIVLAQFLQIMVGLTDQICLQRGQLSSTFQLISSSKIKSTPRYFGTWILGCTSRYFKVF